MRPRLAIAVATAHNRVGQLLEEGACATHDRVTDDDAVAPAEVQDAGACLDLELAFSNVQTTFPPGLITQSYEVDALLSGAINPEFGDPIPISLSGTGTFSVPEPGTLSLLGSGLALMCLWRRQARRA